MSKNNFPISFCLLILSLLINPVISFSQIPEKPATPRLVNDFTGILSAEEVNTLEQKLVNYNDTTSTQILVVLVDDLHGYEPSDFAFRLGENWGVGQQQYNNGAVILIKPKTANSRGQAFIATGYGLEGLIPDALAKRIVDQEMIPEFKNGSYFNGIWRATDIIMGLASGAFKADDYNQSPSPAWFVPVLVFILVLIIMKASKSSNHIGGRRSNLPFWTALWLASQAGGSHSGSWKSFSGGSGGFGGGGSFGGFGGGSFGGGGAGGSW